MLETYCESLAHDKATRLLLLEIKSTGSSQDEIIMSHDVLLRLSESKPAYSKIMLSHARRFLSTEGVRIFTYRERYLLELLGYAVWQDQMTATQASIERK